MYMNNEKIYCVYCGIENNSEARYCKKCKKKLNPKENLLKDYLFEHTKDQLKGNLEDSVFGLDKLSYQHHA